MPDPNPLSEYMRVVRTLNLYKLQLLAIESKLRKGGTPARKSLLEQRHGDISAEMEVLRAEGDDWLDKLRRRVR
ncbi:hypothetical protein SB748_26900 [Rhizobium sp. SIMBA_035]|jgi:hypothetical protein|uniref:hypothetical protein n=1 Tax=Rhizobium sp. RAF36 TaxID=3233055 RepID=UPI000DD744E4